MNAGAKVGGFLAALVVLGAVGAGVGAAIDPIDTEGPDHDRDAAHADDATHAEDDAGHDDAGHDEASGGATGAAASGTSSTQDGYRLDLDPTADEIRFRVLDPEGVPVVETVVAHERPLHLIVVGRDLVGYAHVHPTVAADGTWSVARPDLAPGSYRVVADVQPVGGPELTLGADLTVPGPVSAVAVPPAAPTATVDDLTVTMEGTPAVGDAELAFTVTRAGEPVTPEPYLGARGHLVAFRADDLAYLHVHPLSPSATRGPAGGDGDGTPVAFAATFATPGTYRLFLDVQVDGEVETAAFTVEIPEPGSEPAADRPEPGPAETTPETSVPTSAPATDHEHEEGADHG
ncbi:hypothetical protein HC251_02480 [Iamia sp. SCSIO 61187]|uniref:hypothetical protein n=1 Tax=Iamia sp. SCSIO 61187 TaxID=2722752 RepID=UPI001C6254D1|nr:hypothetical protein [Iamia sp. SCSIO 61187]QYG91411.1 hypothetical protein HC251_02480 [Iamia sp. SCSIO 61187]